MAKLDIKDHVQSILDEYAPQQPDATADALRALWLQFEPKSNVLMAKRL